MIKTAKLGDAPCQRWPELAEFHVRWWDLPFRFSPPRLVEVTGRGVILPMPRPYMRFPASILAIRFDRIDHESNYRGLAVLPNDLLPGYIAAVRFSYNLALISEPVLA